MSEMLNKSTLDWTVEKFKQTQSLPRKASTSTLLSLESETDDSSVMSPEQEEEENKSIIKVLMALKSYRKCSFVHIDRTEAYLDRLPRRQQRYLHNYRQHLEAIRIRISANQKVINDMICDKQDSLDGEFVKLQHQEVDKAQSTLKLIARDWSNECAEEREQSYKPIIEAIEEFFPPDQVQPNETKILVPGAGLGRLTYELATRGYDCEGNEVSCFMLIASRFIINQCESPNFYTLYPWVHQYVNNLQASHQIAPIRFPDICPFLQRPKGNIAFVAGDFLQVYNKSNVYDCVATCFFIDCANNILDFIETIYKILVPGGIWVNLGPLLYNYSEIQGQNSIEPTYDQLKPIIEMIGFEFLRTKTGVRTKYAQNIHSMLKTEYESIFWICRKPLNDCNNVTDSSEESVDLYNNDALSLTNLFIIEKGDSLYYDNNNIKLA